MTEYEKLLKQREAIEKKIKEYEENRLSAGVVDFQYEKIDDNLAWYNIRIKPVICFKSNGYTDRSRPRFRCITAQDTETMFTEIEFLISDIIALRDKLKKKYSE